MRSFKSLIIICIVCLVLCLAGTAAAQEPDKITGMTLETDRLEMEIGQTYQFSPEFTTEAVSGATPIGLHIFSSDENVVKASEELNTVDAIGGGSAVLYIFSYQYEIHTVCEVSVAGEPKALAPKGESWTQPGKKQLAKVSHPELKAFFEMLGEPEMTAAAPFLAASNSFLSEVRVPAGRAESLAEAIRQVGMEFVYAHGSGDIITVRGTVEQYLYLLRSDSILSIDPSVLHHVKENESGMLEGQAETISHISYAHEAGLDGEGTAIAVIDSGFHTTHEQFEDRIIAQVCFSVANFCQNGETEDTNSADINPEYKDTRFSHGTHVAGIAAGKDGVAPNAKLILINAYSATPYACESGTCWNEGFNRADEDRALRYLVNNIASDGTFGGARVAAVNMSLGGLTPNAKACPDDGYEVYFTRLREIGVIPAVASGNEHWDKSISSPACSPSALAVGALWDSGIPEVADYSNHSSLVKILAPGTQILSSVIGDDVDADDAYGLKNGTSMATPMVAGSIALLRQAFPNMPVAQLEALLTGMSSQKAARVKISVPVLDFNKIKEIKAIMASDPEPDTDPLTGLVTIYSGNKFLQMNFPALPFNAAYKITTHTLDVYGDIVQSAKPVSGKNLKAYKIAKLENDTPYRIDIGCTVTLAKGVTYDVPTFSLYGMPMNRSTEFLFSPKSSTSAKARLEFIKKDAPDGKMRANIYAGKDLLRTWTEVDSYPEVDYDQVYTVEFYEAITRNMKTYFTVPGAKISHLALNYPRLVTGDGINGKAWLKFLPEKVATERIVRVEKLIGSDYVFQKELPPVSLKKNPEDILISGLEDGSTYRFIVYNKAKSGGYVYTVGNIFGPVELPEKSSYTWDPVDYNGSTEMISYYLDFTGVTLTGGDRSAVLTFDKSTLFDGYRMQLKPVIPNLKKTEWDIPIAKVKSPFSFTGLVNGNLYKFRIQSYLKTTNEDGVKLTAKSAYYPAAATSREDNAWNGLMFVPLPAPKVFRDSPYSPSSTGIYITRDNAADGFAVILVTSDAEGYGTTLYTQEWTDGSEKTEFRGTNLNTDEVNAVVMLYKEYEGRRFYGPAVTIGDVLYNSGYEYGTGPKAVSMIDLQSIPELADAAQIDGMVFLSDLDTAVSGTKAVDEHPEIRLVEFDEEESIVFDIKDGVTGDAEDLTELPVTAMESGFTFGPFVPDEDADVDPDSEVIRTEDGDIPAGDPYVAEAAAEDGEELQEDEFEVYELADDGSFENEPDDDSIGEAERSEDEFAETPAPVFESELEKVISDLQPEPVKAPEPKKQEKKESGFTLFMFGN